MLRAGVRPPFGIRGAAQRSTPERLAATDCSESREGPGSRCRVLAAAFGAAWEDPGGDPLAPESRAARRGSALSLSVLIPAYNEDVDVERVRAEANPKSSTGRLEVFTRVLTDRNHRFDGALRGNDRRTATPLLQPRSKRRTTPPR